MILRTMPMRLSRVLSLTIALFIFVSLSAAPLEHAFALTAAVQNTAKVSFTFDDGVNSDLLAAQTLQAYGYSGTGYIITGCVGMTTVPNTCLANNTVPYMTWSDISELHNTYGWEIGSHTVTHPLTAAADNPSLTDQQLDYEMSASQAALVAQGYTAADFASPYGDYDNRSLAVIAKYYQSHRTFQDLTYPSDPTEIVNTFPYYSPRSTYPYNNLLLTVLAVQGNVPVATVEGYIDQAKANNQWLILVFHNIVASGASTAEADYQYNATDLGTIAAYVKSQNVPVVNVAQGLPSGTNILPNSSFNAGITAGWSTNDSTKVVADQQATSLAGHGSYDGTPEGPLNSIALTGSATEDTYLMSPKVTVTPGITYTLTNYVNVTSTSGEVDFYVDEYDAAGTWLSGKYVQGITASTTANNVQVGNVNFTYTPTSANVVSADVQAIAHGSSTHAYVDNIEWLSPVAPADTTPPVISNTASSNVTTSGASISWTTDEASTTQVNYGTTSSYGNSTTLDSNLVTSHSTTLTGLSANTTYHYQVISKDAAGNIATSSDMSFTTAIPLKAGDANGDGKVNAIDLSILSSHWGTTAGATRAEGDLNGDGKVNAIDLSILSSNWGK